jgi:hypothetical protein
MLEVLDQHQASPRTVLSLVGGAVGAHLDPSYRMEKPVIRVKNRAVRAALIAVVGCTAVIALVYSLFTYTNVQLLIGDLVWHPGYAEGDVALVLTPDQRLLATLEAASPIPPPPRYGRSAALGRGGCRRSRAALPWPLPRTAVWWPRPRTTGLPRCGT